MTHAVGTSEKETKRGGVGVVHRKWIEKRVECNSSTFSEENIVTFLAVLGTNRSACSCGWFRPSHGKRISSDNSPKGRFSEQPFTGQQTHEQEFVVLTPQEIDKANKGCVKEAATISVPWGGFINSLHIAREKPILCFSKAKFVLNEAH